MNRSVILDLDIIKGRQEPIASLYLSSPDNESIGLLFIKRKCGTFAGNNVIYQPGMKTSEYMSRDIPTVLKAKPVETPQGDGPIYLRVVLQWMSHNGFNAIIDPATSSVVDNTYKSHPYFRSIFCVEKGKV
jgi:hypothetical protein